MMEHDGVEVFHRPAAKEYYEPKHEDVDSDL